jgi:hypothetical protein
MSSKAPASSLGQKTAVNRKSNGPCTTQNPNIICPFALYATFFLVAISLLYQPVNLNAKKRLSDLRKDYAVVREAKIPVRQKPGPQGKILGHALFGHILRTSTKINPARGLRQHDKWLPIRQKNGPKGYVRTKQVLLLDKGQYRLWQQNYTPYRVTADKATATRQWLKVQRLFAPQDKKRFSLPQGAIVWADKVEKKKVYFRDLSLRLSYTLAWLGRGDVRPRQKSP